MNPKAPTTTAQTAGSNGESVRVSVAYVEHGTAFWREIALPAGTTAAAAVEQSALQAHFPHRDFSECKLGIFSKPIKADRVLQDGDRVEVYRPITADPETVPRNDQPAEASS